jgi:hypothetical protein
MYPKTSIIKQTNTEKLILEIDMEPLNRTCLISRNFSKVLEGVGDPYNYIVSEPLPSKLERIADKRNNFEQIIITACTSGFKAFLYNWMCSVENIPKAESNGVNLLNHVLIYTVDASLAHELIVKRKFYNVYLDKRADAANINTKVPLNFETLSYQKLIMLRTEFIKDVLVTYNYRIFLVDNDAVWLRNPYNFILNGQFTNYDMIAANDELPHTKKQMICGGFLYINNTINSTITWTNITNQYSTLIKKIRKGTMDNEQYMLQRLSKQNVFKVAYLPIEIFTNGLYFFKYFDSIKYDPKIYIVHNNFVVGRQKKLQRFQKEKGYLWQVGDDLKCIPRRIPEKH